MNPSVHQYTDPSIHQSVNQPTNNFLKKSVYCYRFPPKFTPRQKYKICQIINVLIK